MMEAILSSEMSVLTRFTLHHIQEGSIFHGHRRENVKSFKLSAVEIFAEFFFAEVTTA
jgi:hypothetical protein